MVHASPFHEADGDYRTEKFMEGGTHALPLYSHQKSLPRLPVPTLEETFARYLLSVQPLTTGDEFQRTVAAVRSFLRPGGLVSEQGVSSLVLLCAVVVGGCVFCRWRRCYITGSVISRPANTRNVEC